MGGTLFLALNKLKRNYPKQMFFRGKGRKAMTSSQIKIWSVDVINSPSLPLCELQHSVPFDGSQTSQKKIDPSRSWGCQGETLLFVLRELNMPPLTKLKSCNPQQQNSFPNRKGIGAKHYIVQVFNIKWRNYLQQNVFRNIQTKNFLSL